jgi:hypothetical protein
LKQQCDGAGEHLNYDKLRVAGHGVGNTRARRTNTAKRAPNMLMHHGHVPVHVCTISNLWDFHTNPYYPSKNYELKQQGDGAGEHLNYDKLRVAGHGVCNTRARRTNTANRAPNMLMHHGHVAVPVCTISILWNFFTTPYHPSETTS